MPATKSTSIELLPDNQRDSEGAAQTDAARPKSRGRRASVSDFASEDEYAKAQLAYWESRVCTIINDAEEEEDGEDDSVTIYTVTIR